MTESTALVPAPDQQRQSLQLREQQLRLKLLETTIDFYATLGILDPRDLQAELDGWGFYPTMVPPYYRQSQKRGEVLPVYTTEQQRERPGELTHPRLCAIFPAYKDYCSDLTYGLSISHDPDAGKRPY
jgi:hypothetical protein